MQFIALQRYRRHCELRKKKDGQTGALVHSREKKNTPANVYADLYTAGGTK